MEQHEIGRFYATSFDEKNFEFIVYDDYTIDCPTLGFKNFDYMELKPRFTLSGKDFYYKYDARPYHGFGVCRLIKDYNINEELFQFMNKNGMIRYSTDMAYLYGFSDKNGYDSDPRYFGVGSPYKWAKKKGPILVKQKSGHFN